MDSELSAAASVEYVEHRPEHAPVISFFLYTFDSAGVKLEAWRQITSFYILF